MGACCSSSAPEKYEARSPSAPAKTDSTRMPRASSKARSAIPDFGLSSTHEVVKLLGRGGEGETWLCRERSTGGELAIKLIKRPIPKVAIAVIKREIKIQSELGQGHVNIVAANEVLLSRTHLGLVLEYVPGGNMVSFVTKKRETKHERGGLCMDEDEARYYFTQLVSAVDYCHKHQVAHRDLKLDNTLLDMSKPPRVKLCDFGFAKHWQANSNMDTMRIGTPEYMGPELISSRNGYDGKKVDVWAAGVLLYVMLAGIFPFETQDDNFNNTAGLYDIWLQQIKTSWRDLPNNSSPVSRLSPDLKDLLDKIFEVKQDARIDVAGIKAHPWFKRPLGPPYAAALEEMQRVQALLDEEFAASPPANAERDKKLEAMLDRAAGQAMPTEPEVMRLSLSRIKRSASLVASPPSSAIGGMQTLKEED